MKPNNAIEVTDVTKSFKVYFDKGNTMKEKVLFQKRRRYEERRVLDGICFEVKKGEAIGLIGHNGCGKSTTLKLLCTLLRKFSSGRQTASHVRYPLLRRRLYRNWHQEAPIPKTIYSAST